MENTKEYTGKEQILHCPFCTGEYTHLVNVETYNAVAGEDRLSVILTFECEDGHRFKIDFHQHEGQTIIKY